MGKLNSVRDGSDIDKPMPRQRQVPTSTFGEVKKNYICIQASVEREDDDFSKSRMNPWGRLDFSNCLSNLFNQGIF